jgi:hypothetical protein
LQRYQIPQRIDREHARASLRSFLTGHRPIASDAAKKAVLDEDFVAYIPFWVGWVRVLGWIFGQKKVRQNDSTRYVPREVKVTQDMTWNSAACDVGEFGVDTIPYTNQPLEPFNPEMLHNSWMVFEPTGSAGDARAAANKIFQSVFASPPI